MPLDAFREANRKNWNDRVPVHLEAWGYSMAKFVEDPNYIADGGEIHRCSTSSASLALTHSHGQGSGPP